MPQPYTKKYSHKPKHKVDDDKDNNVAYVNDK